MGLRLRVPPSPPKPAPAFEVNLPISFLQMRARGPRGQLGAEVQSAGSGGRAPRTFPQPAVCREGVLTPEHGTRQVLHGVNRKAPGQDPRS